MEYKRKVGRPAIDPSLKKKAICVALPISLIAWLDDQDESRAILIERALLNEYAMRFDTDDPL
jgi:hypothetical protein